MTDPLDRKNQVRIDNYNHARRLCGKLDLNISELGRNSASELQSAILRILEKLIEGDKE